MLSSDCLSNRGVVAMDEVFVNSEEKRWVYSLYGICRNVQTKNSFTKS